MVRQRLTLFAESFRAHLASIEFNHSAAALLGLLLVYALGTSFYEALHRPLWYDEILTVAIARHSTVSEIWSALNSAVDGNPPPFYLVERYAASLLADEHIGYRLVSIFSFVCVLLCLFAYARLRIGPVGALIAAVVPLLTVLYHTYSVEARPYALVTACLSFALICWQRVARFGWQLLFGLSLAAAASLHYYAILAFVPFAIGEGAYLLRYRRLRVSVWVGLLCGALPLLAFWPLLMSQKAYYGLNFWAKPSYVTAFSSYSSFFRGLDNGTGVGVVLVLTVVLFTAVAVPKLWQLTPIGTAVPIEELFLAMGFVWLPSMGVVIAKIANGGFTPRYTMPAILGIALSAAYLFHWLGYRAAVLLLGLLFSVFACREALFWVNQPREGATMTSPSTGIEKLLQTAAPGDLPVVISSGHEYLQIAYYGSPRFSQRLFALVDRAEAIQYVRSDTLELSLLAVRQYLPLNIYEYSEFASVHPVFLLYSNRDSLDWWPTRLSHDGHFLRVMAFERGHILYLVKLKASVSAPLPH
jgi:4-amino-4-deoxy-L-arabinose transferase-like glycosyltransferase